MRLTQPIFVLKRLARRRSRAMGIPLHAALDQIAHAEGFRSWGHLSAYAASPYSARELLEQLSPGDLMLLAARPGQGKTVLGLRLVVEALQAGRSAAFFTLAYTDAEVRAWLARLAQTPAAHGPRLRIDSSADITAEHIIAALEGCDANTVVVIDYLQLLDRRRTAPVLGDQLAPLRAFTRSQGLVTVCLSQVDRGYDASARPVPSFTDVSFPNPVQRSVFTAGCFLHAGRMALERWATP